MSMSLMNGSEPASLAQHGMWVTERAGLGGAVYHMAFAVHLDGPLDTYRMLAACGAVVRRHPVLAAALVERDGRLHMAPAAVPPKIGYEDLSDGGPALLPGSPEWLASPLSPGLDLSTGPVSAFTLVRLAPDLHTLLVVVHHAVCDGVSEELLLRDLAAAYGGAELPPLPVSYGEAASAETARVEDKLEEAARFWRSRWHDEEDVLLPGARRARLRAVPGEAVDLALGGGVAETAERLGVTRFEFTLAAFQVLLHAYGNERATVSIDVSTRTEQTREHVGLFVNELPVALTPSGTFAGFAHVVRRQLREVYRLREVPVARALGGISPRSALTPVSMSFRRVDDEIGFAGLDASVELSMFTGYVRGTLHLHALDSPYGITSRLQFDPEVLDRASCEMIAADLRALIAGVVARPDAPIGELPLPSRAGSVQAGALPATGAFPEAVPAFERAAGTETEPDDDLIGEVTAIWCETLNRPDIKPDDDLFDLGGHSLDITRIVALVRERMDVDLSFEVFIDAPTVAGIAEEIVRSRR